MSVSASPAVLTDAFTIPHVSTRVRTATMIVAFAALTALLAQVRINIGWTPVPITGQTFGVLLAGAALGSRKGALSQLLYVVAGLALPVYTDGHQGWAYFTGATGGYLVGMVVAAYLVGLLAERHQDRAFVTSLPAMIFGSVVVYAFGVPWLAHVTGMSTQNAILKGMAPFVMGDMLKAIVAGALLPSVWRFSNAR